MKYIFLLLFVFLIGFDGFSQEESRKDAIRFVWEKVKNCHIERRKAPILEVRDFLKAKGYDVQTNGDLTTSLKKAILKYHKDQGIPIHTLEYVFELDMKKINDKFCECIFSFK